jgi:hypothetical protein
MIMFATNMRLLLLLRLINRIDPKLLVKAQEASVDFNVHDIPKLHLIIPLYDIDPLALLPNTLTDQQIRNLLDDDLAFEVWVADLELDKETS